MVTSFITHRAFLCILKQIKVTVCLSTAQLGYFVNEEVVNEKSRESHSGRLTWLGIS